VVGQVVRVSSRAVSGRAMVVEGLRLAGVLEAHKEVAVDDSQVQSIVSNRSHWVVVPERAAVVGIDCVEGQQETGLGQKRCLVDYRQDPEGMGRSFPSRVDEDDMVSEGVVEVDDGLAGDKTAEAEYPVVAVVYDRALHCIVKSQDATTPCLRRDVGFVVAQMSRLTAHASGSVSACFRLQQQYDNTECAAKSRERYCDHED
jgi:hypothetical protein